MFFLLNNRKYEVIEEYKNSLIYQFVSYLGVDLPCFCYSEALSVAGNCRMCLVEVKGAPKLLASCAIPISKDMEVFTESLRLQKAREGVLELLLINHPLDCPVCDQGGECDLQDLTFRFGSDRGRFYEAEKRAVIDKDAGVFVKTIMTRCIHCTRCVRFFRDILGEREVGLFGRGEDSEIVLLNNLTHPLSGNVVDVCPVGALTSKPYTFSARPWELQSFESFDVFDSMCSVLRIDMSMGKIMRIMPVNNSEVNEDWLPNKTRYFFDMLNKQRVVQPAIVGSGGFLIRELWDSGISVLISLLLINFFYGKKLSWFLDPFIDYKSSLYVKEFFTSLGVYSGSINKDIRENYFSSVSLSDFGNKRFIFLVGTSLRMDIPLLNVKLKRLSLKGVLIFIFGGYDSISGFTAVSLGNKISHVFDSLYFRNIILNKFIAPAALFVRIFYKSFCFNRNLFICNTSAVSFPTVGLIRNLVLGSSFGYFTVLNKSLGYLASSEVGLDFFKKNSLSSIDLWFGLTPFLNYRRSFGLNVLFCSFVPRDWDGLNLVLPVKNFFEADNLYFDYKGVLKKYERISNPPVGIQCLYDVMKVILLVLRNYFSNPFSFMDYEVLSYFPASLVSKFSCYFEVKNVELKVQEHLTNYYSDSVFNRESLNYYKGDFTGTASLLLSRASKDFKSNIKVYY